uniref:Uncharacterized protein n=1 Tax=Triticum urartu TaxID=4572 RepID=A0A8R7PIB6_TRIUA
MTPSAAAERKLISPIESLANTQVCCKPANIYIPRHLAALSEAPDRTKADTRICLRLVPGEVDRGGEEGGHGGGEREADDGGGGRRCEPEGSVQEARRLRQGEGLGAAPQPKEPSARHGRRGRGAIGAVHVERGGAEGLAGLGGEGEGAPRRGALRRAALPHPAL